MAAPAWRAEDFTLSSTHNKRDLPMMRIAAVGAFIVLSCAAAFAGGNAAPAPSAKAQPARGGACAADVERFCNDVPFGEGRRLACLARHEAQLAPACRPWLKTMQAMFAQAQKQLQLNRTIEAKKKAEDAKQQAAKQKAAAEGNPLSPPANKR